MKILDFSTDLNQDILPAILAGNYLLRNNKVSNLHFMNLDIVKAFDTAFHLFFAAKMSTDIFY